MEQPSRRTFIAGASAAAGLLAGAFGPMRAALAQEYATPFGPSSPSTSPRAKVSETSWTARRVPKSRDRPEATRVGSEGVFKGSTGRRNLRWNRRPDRAA